MTSHIDQYPATNQLSSGTRLSLNVSLLAYPLMRVTTGLLLMPHGAQKLFGLFGGYGLTGTGMYFGDTLDQRWLRIPAYVVGVCFCACAGRWQRVFP
jgi:uncharacterized membrane protein YphA (DoxX/SURF4 family)